MLYYGYDADNLRVSSRNIFTERSNHQIHDMLLINTIMWFTFLTLFEISNSLRTLNAFSTGIGIAP